MRDRLSAMLGMAYRNRVIRRFRKPRRHKQHQYPRIEAMPGSVLDLTYNGEVVARLVLDRVSRDYQHGTTAVFVDYFHYERNRRNG